MHRRRSASFFFVDLTASGRRMLVRLDAAGVELKLGQLRLQAFLSQSFEDLSPDAFSAPAIEPSPDAVPVAEPLGQIPPGDAVFKT